MGWRKGIRNPIAIEAYETFEKMPSLDWHSLETPYCLVAFALTANTNPKSPLTGYAVYACEVIRMSPRSVTLNLGEPVRRFGWGRLPNSPYTVSFCKCRGVKLIGKKEKEEE